MTTISENQAQFTCSVVGTGLVAAGTGLGGFLGGPVGATLMATLTGAVKATFTDDCTAYLTNMDIDNSYGPSYVPHSSSLELIGFSSRNWSPNKVGAVKLLDLGQSALDDWDMSDLSGSVINGLGFNAYGTKWAEKIGGTIYSDKIYGLGGNDYLVGGKGNDTLNGGDGDDTLRGGVEADSLFDGTGADRMWGGEGNDTFVFSTNNDGKVDSIEDFVWDRDSAKGFGTVASYKVAALGSLRGITEATDNDGDVIRFTGTEAHTVAELDTMAEVRAVVEHMLL